MLVTIYTSHRVTVGSADYAKVKAQAERIAQQQVNVGCGGVCRWVDDYNDYSAQGRFVVTARAIVKAA